MLSARTLYNRNNVHELVKTESLERKNISFTLVFKTYIIVVLSSLRKLENWVKTRTKFNIISDKNKMLAYIAVNLKTLRDCKKDRFKLNPESLQRIEVEEGRWLQLESLIKELGPRSSEAEINDFKEVALSYFERLNAALLSVNEDVGFAIKSSW